MAKRDMLWVMGMPWPAALMALLCATLVIGFVGGRLQYRPFRAPSGSMQPYLWPGDHFVVDKWAYADNDPQLGDVVAFRGPREQTYVKRIAGVPGQTVQLRDAVLFIDGRPVRLERMGVHAIIDHRYGYDGEESGEAVMLGAMRETLPNGVSYLVFDRGASEGDNTRSYLLYPDQFFMLGDDRDNSSDSRFEVQGFGFVEREAIVGKAVLILPGGNHQKVQ